MHLFGVESPPHLSSVYASLSTSRYPAQDSRPSGSLLLSREELSSSASCRFIPAHCNRLISSTIIWAQADNDEKRRHPATETGRIRVGVSFALTPCAQGVCVGA